MRVKDIPYSEARLCRSAKCLVRENADSAPRWETTVRGRTITRYVDVLSHPDFACGGQLYHCYVVGKDSYLVMCEHMVDLEYAA